MLIVAINYKFEKTDNKDLVQSSLKSRHWWVTQYVTAKCDNKPYSFHLSFHFGLDDTEAVGEKITSLPDLNRNQYFVLKQEPILCTETGTNTLY